jgi:hypothetical protein
VTPPPCRTLHDDGVDKRRRRILIGYGIGLPLAMLGVNYRRGLDNGASSGLAALASALALVFFLGLAGWALFDHKRKGGEIRWSGQSDLHPGEGRQPRGWWWDERSRRWRKPPRPDPD